MTRWPKALLALLAAALLLALAGATVQAFASKPPVPPGKEPCAHGNSGKPCRPDPQPTHGKACQAHGKGGINEDHCAGGTSSTSTTTSTSTQSTSTSTSSTTTTSTITASTTTNETSSSSTSTAARSTTTSGSTPTTSTPETTTSSVAAATSTGAGPPSPPTRPASVPPTKQRLQAELKRQERLHGTGRVSHGNRPGELANTGLNEWLAFAVGLCLTLGGLGVRRLTKENA